ncbi:MAG: hypothetical protein ACUVQ1_04660 [Candidatus Kapaibacteriales bacterium]
MYFIFAKKWCLTSIFAVGLAFSMAYFIKVKILYVILGSIAVLISGIIFYHNPIITFVVGIIATTIALTLSGEEANQWLGETLGFTKRIIPLLNVCVFVAGFLLGSNN